MMLMQLAGLSLLLAVQVLAQDQYMVVFPKKLRNGRPFEVEVALLEPAPSNVNAQVSIRRNQALDSALGWTDSMLNVQIGTGETTGSSSIQVPYEVSVGITYYVHVQMTGFTSKMIIEKPVEVETERLPSGLFVQTNKPIYKPKDTVKFRVIAVDNELIPVDQSVTVEIKDPSGRILMHKETDANVVDYVPIVSDEFTLSDQPEFGDYTVSVLTSTDYNTVKFKVEEYVLPKFEVSVDIEKGYGVLGDGNVIRGNVTAKYSYGKSLVGFLDLSSNGQIVLKRVEINGTKAFEIPITQSSEMPEFFFRDRMSFKSTMMIEATVTESLTNNTMSDEASFTLYRTDFMATPLTPLPVLFNGSLTYSFQVNLTNADGGLYPEGSIDPKNYQLKYSYNGREASMDFTGNPMTVDVRLSPKIKFPSIEVWFVHSDGTTKTESARKQVNVPTYFAGEGSKVEVTLTDETKYLTTRKCFQVTPYNNGDKVFYQILDNFGAGPLMAYTQTGGHCITIERRHSPKFMIVAYRVGTTTNPDTGNEVRDLVSANIIVDIPWTTSQEVSIEVSPMEVKPGEEVEITLRTKGPCVVALTSMDKSLTFLADAKNLELSQLKETWESTRLFEVKTPSEPVYNPIWDDGPVMMFKRKKRCIACWGNSVYLDTVKLLEDSGLGVITNLFIYRDSTNVGSGGIDYYYDLAEMLPPAVADQEDILDGNAEAIDDADKTAGAGFKQPAPEQKVRKDFREVWLWSIEITPNSGTKTLVQQVPDVITSWITSAYAFNRQYGLGVAENVEVKVLQDFFLSMNLPYSVIRGEMFELELLVTNYMSSDLQVDMILDQTADYVVEPGQMSKINQRIMVKSQLSGLVKISIKMLSLGKPVIKARAMMVGGASKVDRVERELIVKAEGREITSDLSVTIPMPSAPRDVQLDLSSFFQEPNIVQGSIKMKLYVTGDMMGPVIATIGSNIRMPSGCGEQNIQSLTPGLFGSLYLKKINRLKPELVDKVRRVLNSGYIRELNYKHPDGSYSAFGAGPGLCTCGAEGQKKGSTWLTAYVLKMFSLLYTHEMTYVDFGILTEAFQYLKDTSRPACEDQYFVELGQLIHTEMQGGTSSRFGFTAFVLVSILEYRDAAEKANNVNILTMADTTINGAANWLNDNVDDVIASNNPYQLAIVAYALARSGQHAETARTLIERLDLNSSVSTTGECMAKPSDSGYTKCTSDSDCENSGYRYGPAQKCCKIPCENGKKACTSTGSPYRQSGSTKIETYGYTLMAALELHKTFTSTNKWRDLADNMKDTLLSKRDGNGFFSSTQDTAVALEALARYSMDFPNSNGAIFALRGKVNETFLSDTFVMSVDNYTVRGELDLPVSTKPNSVSVEILRGEIGTAYLNLMVMYNVQTNETSKPLIIELTPGKTKDNETALKQCFKKNPDFEEELSSMIVTELNLPTGTEFSTTNVEDIRDINQSPTKIEVEDNKQTVVAYYMNEDGAFSDWICLEIRYTRNFEIKNPQPSMVMAMDYYNQENNVAMLYREDPKSVECFNCPTTGASAAGVNTYLMMLTTLCLTLITYVRGL